MLLENHPNIVTPIVLPTVCLASLPFFHIIHIIDREIRNALVRFKRQRYSVMNTYYPVPLHRQKAYCNRGRTRHTTPVTNQLVKEVGISLPMPHSWNFW